MADNRELSTLWHVTHAPHCQLPTTTAKVACLRCFSYFLFREKVSECLSAVQCAIIMCTSVCVCLLLTFLYVNTRRVTRKTSTRCLNCLYHKQILCECCVSECCSFNCQTKVRVFSARGKNNNNKMLHMSVGAVNSACPKSV